MIKKQSFVLLVLFLLSVHLLVLPVNVFGVEGEGDEFCEKLPRYKKYIPLTSYEKRQKFGTSGSTYVKDEGVWAYTTWFRKKFGMPCRWVDNKQKGVEGVTVYFARTTRKRCHDTGNGKEKCLRSWQLHLDLYLPPKTDIGLTGNYDRNSKPVFNSLTELAEKNPELKERWESLFDLRDVRMYLQSPAGMKKEIFIEPIQYKRNAIGNMVIVKTLVNKELILGPSDQMRVIEFRNEQGQVVHSVELSKKYVQTIIKYPDNFPELLVDSWSGGRESGDFVWVYSREFAEQYGLPEENISEELEGALAIAFRMAHYGSIRCGYFGGGDDPGSCSEEIQKLFEFYLPDDANIHYRNDKRLWENFTSGHSGLFVKYENKLDRKPSFHFIGYDSSPKIVFHIIRRQIEKYKIFSEKKYKTTGHESLNVMGFYRPKQLSESFGYFQVPGLSMLESDESYLVFTDSTKVTKYKRNEMFEKNFHKVKIPKSFREQVLKKQKEFNRREESLWKKVTDRLGIN